MTTLVLYNTILDSKNKMNEEYEMVIKEMQERKFYINVQVTEPYYKI